MDAEKLQKRLEKEMAAAGTDGPALLAKFVGQVVARLKKAADHLGKAAKHIGEAIDHNEKMSEQMDALGDHHDAMEGHMDGMKSCLGKAVASGKLGKVEDAGDAKDMTTHMSGMESAHGEMGKAHGAIEKLISDQETALDSAGGAIDDAVDAADEENDKGLAAAERTEKMRKRDNAKLKKSLERKHGREMTALAKKLEKSGQAQLASMESGFNALLKALAPAPAAPAGLEKVVPIRTAPMEKAVPGAAPGSVPVAPVAGGVEIAAVDQYGMPNPEFIKGVQNGTINDDKAFEKAAGKVEAQVGDPFPKNGDDLFAATRGAVA